MYKRLGWLVLIGIFLFAGEGLNLIRENLEDWVAYGRWYNALVCALGFTMTLIGTSFLGGFIYFREKKRNRLKKSIRDNRDRFAKRI